MLSDQFVADTLSGAGWWKRETLFFLGEVVKPGWKTALSWVNGWVAMFSQPTYAIVNKTEEGIAVIPLKFKGQTIEPVMKKFAFIPGKDIVSIQMKKAFLAKKLVVHTKDGKKSGFIVGEKNGKVLQHEKNLQEFILLYVQK